MEVTPVSLGQTNDETEQAGNTIEQTDHLIEQQGAANATSETDEVVDTQAPNDGVDGETDTSNEQDNQDEANVDSVDDLQEVETTEDALINKDEPGINQGEDAQANDQREESEQTDDVTNELKLEPTNADDLNPIEGKSETSEEDYDPEAGFNQVQEQEHEARPSQDEDDDYDPEVSLRHDEPKSIPPRPPSGLPPKPPVVATSLKLSSPPAQRSPLVPGDQSQLNEAYQAIMQSDLVKDPNFANLSQVDQMKLIVEKLNDKNVHLTSPSNTQMNYDQVYSFNKPFKNLKNPIPLVPVNQYCRRPNITAPMSPEEEKAYQDFIQTEAYYMKLQNWDEFPDKSRLFIGNLPANTISKQDLFRIFSQYGEIIQIAIKAGFGFAQFRTAEACLECIKGETDVPLHNKIMRLDASKPQKSRKSGREDVNNPNMGARGRERSQEDEDSESKRRKTAADCQVYITGKSSVFFIRKVKKAFANAQITINTEDVTYKNIQDVISEAAYSGVLGTCVINELKVDVQTFESSPDGGIKFDEYADIEPEIAADILAKAKRTKYGPDMPPYYPQSTNHNDNASGSYAEEKHQEYGGYGHRGYGGNQYGDQNRRGGGRRDGGRGGDRYGAGRYDNYDQGQGWDHHEPQPYGQPPPHYGPGPSYGNQGSSYNQMQPNSYGGGHQGYEKYRNPASQGYGRNPVPQGYDRYEPAQAQSPNVPNQQQIAQQLQNLDPQSMQTMLNLLQQQQQQQQQSQPPQHHLYGQPQPPQQGSYGGYNDRGQYGQQQMNPQANQVNALLSQLQQKPSNNQNQGQASANTQALMDTLARLTRQ